MRKIVAAMSALFLTSSFAWAGDDKEDLANAAKKVGELKSYSFKAKIEVDGSPMPMDPIEIDGKHQSDTATWLSGAIMGQDFEAYRKGEKLATKDMEGNWSLAGGRGQGRGGMGMGMLTRVVKSPHEELKEVETKFKEIKKAEAKETVGETDCFVYSGDLTEEAAKGMMPMGGGLGGMGEITGKGKIWVDKDGIIRKYAFDIALSIDFQGNALEIAVNRSTEFSNLDDTKVEVPEEVQKLFTD